MSCILPESGIERICSRKICLLLGSEAGLRVAIQSTLETAFLGRRASAVRLTAASAAMRSASLTLASTSARAMTTLGLCIWTMPRMLA
jgi:hypothetical protein